MVEPRFFLFLGDDEEAKTKRLAAFCGAAFSVGFKDLNYSLLYADEKNFTPQRLSDTLFALPVGGAKQRVVFIRNAQQLTPVCLALLDRVLDQVFHHVLVVLDISEAGAGAGVAARFEKKGAEVVRFREAKPDNVFDLGRAILSSRPDAALRILKRLLQVRERPEKLIGALFWRWERSYEEKGVGEEAYRRGLRVLSDADRRLKSSSSLIRETLILEALVVKLSYLVQNRRPAVSSHQSN